MRLTGRLGLAALLGILLGLTFAVPVGAIEEAVSDLVLIRAEDVVSDDLLAGGNIIRIKGTIEGDLVATAFEVIEIEGTVTGDVLALAPRLIIRGEVLGSVRSMAASTVIEGFVGGDVLTASGRLTVDGEVLGDIHAWALDMAAAGDLGEDLTLRALRARVSGAVRGDLEGTIRRLAIDEGAVIGGDVVVRGKIDLADSASIGGSARTPTSRAVPLQARAYGVVGLLVLLSLWSLAGPAVQRWAPGWLDLHLEGRSTVRWLLWGAGSVLGLAILVGLLGLLTALASSEAAVVLGVVTVFVAVAGAILLAAAALVGAVPATMRVGQRLGSPPTKTSAHVRGVAAIFALSLVPWVGGVVAVAFLLLAMGAVLARRSPGS